MKIRRSAPVRLFLYFVFVAVLVITAIFIGQPVLTHASTKQNLSSQDPTVNPIPVLAYYYIWYNTSSWNRAKTDTPLLGTYSSDDLAVMRQHIEEAKAVGISGFIVSWKSTEVLNRRLDQLANLAAQENFKLAIIYQGLDFYRDPLPVTQVAGDLDFFIQNYASLPAFQLFSKPLVIWSGTWKFSTQDIEQVTLSRRNSLLILASERNTDGYSRLANLVDGDAYYWSSVNPDTFPNYQDKLNQMSDLVHANKGLWIAPAAPGFDARLIGGTTVVDRKDGATFRIEINTAMASSPDALGIISWNEFSENSQIEPSQKYGNQYLNIVSEINQTPSPNVIEFDSSIPNRIFPEVVPGSRMIALGGLLLLILASMVLIILRR
jgi:hypothetical protein